MDHRQRLLLSPLTIRMKPGRILQMSRGDTEGLSVCRAIQAFTRANVQVQRALGLVAVFEHLEWSRDLCLAKAHSQLKPESINLLK
jgi:hypothetical protein